MDLQKRNFLKKGSQLFFGAYALNTIIKPTNKKIIIIGAGVAGLSAAYHLKKQGFTNVLILEASRRKGGRIYTSQSDEGHLIELGANWIHGINKNPVADFCKQKNIAILKTLSDQKTDFIYKCPSGIIANAEFQKDIFFYNAILKKCRDKINNLDTDQPLQKTFDEVLAKTTVDQHQKSWIKNYIKLDIEENYGAQALELSSFEWMGSESWFSGGDHVLPLGYDQLIQALAKDQLIYLEHKTEWIRKTSAGFDVFCSNNTKWSASDVIVTVPLGVLKANSIKFEPELTIKKKQAISRAGFGHFCKVFVFLNPENTIPWNNLPTWLMTMDMSHSPQQRSFQFFNYAKFLKHPILIGISTGDEALRLQEMDKNELKKYILQRAPMLKENDIVQIESSKWSQDPLSLGAYSFPKYNAPVKLFDDIGSSIGQLHFAGEACQSDIFGSVDAAFISGQRICNKIIESQFLNV